MSMSLDERDWRYEIANGDTQLGFVNWLAHRRGAEEVATPWCVPYEDLVGSVRLAMESAGIGADVISEVLTTVEDYAVNHHGEEE